jgi:hypothetical protein
VGDFVSRVIHIDFFIGVVISIGVFIGVVVVIGVVIGVVISVVIGVDIRFFIGLSPTVEVAQSRLSAAHEAGPGMGLCRKGQSGADRHAGKPAVSSS